MYRKSTEFLWTSVCSHLSLYGILSALRSLVADRNPQHRFNEVWLGGTKKLQREGRQEQL